MEKADSCEAIRFNSTGDTHSLIRSFARAHLSLGAVNHMPPLKQSHLSVGHEAEAGLCEQGRVFFAAEHEIEKNGNLRRVALCCR